MNDPGLLTGAKEAKDWEAAASPRRVSLLLPSYLLKANASKEPGGLSQLSWNFGEGGLCYI